MSQLVVLDAVDVPQRYPRALGRQPLVTINNAREEMARVYRAVAAGKISTKQGTSLVYMLSTIAKTIEAEKLEGQIDAVLQEQTR